MVEDFFFKYTSYCNTTAMVVVCDQFVSSRIVECRPNRVSWAKGKARLAKWYATLMHRSQILFIMQEKKMLNCFYCNILCVYSRYLKKHSRCIFFNCLRYKRVCHVLSAIEFELNCVLSIITSCKIALCVSSSFDWLAHAVRDYALLYLSAHSEVLLKPVPLRRWLSYQYYIIALWIIHQSL